MPLNNPASPVAPPAPAVPQPQPRPEPRTYPRLLYQYSDEYPGFTYARVESAEEEAQIFAGNQDAIAKAKQSQQQPPERWQRVRQGEPKPEDAKFGADTAPEAQQGAGERWKRTKKDEAAAAPVAPPAADLGWYDTPEEARYARARAHRPYEEYGRDVAGPITWPPGTTEAMKATAEAIYAQPATPAAPAAADASPYPKLKYQAIDEAPGFKYVKMTNPDDESALAGSDSGPWFDTPAEAIAVSPEPQKVAGQRPTQTGFESQVGPAAPEGEGGPSVPAAHGGAADAAKDKEKDNAKDKEKDKEKDGKPGNGKHKS
jgi:hypothetical protein